MRGRRPWHPAGEVVRLFGRIRENRRRSRTVRRTGGNGGGEPRAHNLFDAAAAYVAAAAENDQEGIDEAAGWVSPEALSFGVNELACRAVIALARARGASPREVARDLLGLPAS